MAFCALDRLCVVYDATNDLPGYSHHNSICQGCRDNVRNTLNQLRYDYVDLSQLLVPIDTRNEQGKIARPKPESKPPINMAVYTLRGDIAYFVTVVALNLRRHVGSAYRHLGLPVREGYGLDHDVRWLSEHVDDLAGLGERTAYFFTGDVQPQTLTGVQMALHLQVLHRRARKMCGTDPRTITVPGSCPHCNTPSFRRHDNDPEKIWCLHCKLHFSAAEYGRVVRLQIPPMRNPTE